jgi:hypothetical protein
MAWYRAALVILVSIAALACAPREPNQPLWLEAGCSSIDEQLFLEAVRTWNEVGNEHVGADLIDFQGTWDDKNGLDPERDLNDGRPVFYCIDEATVLALRPPGTPSETIILGYGFGEDILAASQLVRDRLTAAVKDDVLPDEGFLEASVREMFLHELGHWVGLYDKKDESRRGSIMYYTSGNDGTTKDGPDAADIADLCVVYDCVKQP